MIAESSSEVEN